MTAILKRNIIQYRIEYLLFLFSFLFVFLLSKCSPLYFFNEWCDPNIYFGMGKAAFDGKVLYKDIFDHKGPLIFFIYGFGSIFYTKSLLSIYFIESLFLFVNLLFAYKTALLYLRKEYAFTASLLYAVILFLKSQTGGSADEFITMFMMVSFYYFMLYFSKIRESEFPENKHFFIHGLTFASVFFIKFSACAFWIPLLFVVFFRFIWAKQYKKLLSAVLCFILGLSVLCAPILLYFIANSSFYDFYKAYFEFNSLYAGTTHFNYYFILDIIVRFIKILISLDIYFIIIVFGLCVFIFSKKYIKDILPRIAVAASFVLTYLPMAVSPVGYANYVYIVLAVFALGGLMFMFSVIDRWQIKINIRIFYIASFSIALILGSCNKQFFHIDADCLLRKKEYNYYQKDFALIINQEEGATLLDLGLEHGVYTAANIIPQYKYFFHPYISDEVFPEIRLSHIKLVKEKTPLFIVSENTDFPHLMENYKVVCSHAENKAKTVFLLKRR